MGDQLTFPPLFTLTLFTFTFTLLFIHHDHRPDHYFPLSFLFLLSLFFFISLFPYFLSIMITVLLALTSPFSPLFTFIFHFYFIFTFTLPFIHHDHRPDPYFPLSFLLLLSLLFFISLLLILFIHHDHCPDPNFPLSPTF